MTGGGAERTDHSPCHFHPWRALSWEDYGREENNPIWPSPPPVPRIQRLLSVVTTHGVPVTGPVPPPSHAPCRHVHPASPTDLASTLPTRRRRRHAKISHHKQRASWTAQVAHHSCSFPLSPDLRADPIPSHQRSSHGHLGLPRHRRARRLRRVRPHPLRRRLRPLRHLRPTAPALRRDLLPLLRALHLLRRAPLRRRGALPLRPPPEGPARLRLPPPERAAAAVLWRRRRRPPRIRLRIQAPARLRLPPPAGGAALLRRRRRLRLRIQAQARLRLPPPAGGGHLRIWVRQEAAAGAGHLRLRVREQGAGRGQLRFRIRQEAAGRADLRIGVRFWVRKEAGGGGELWIRVWRQAAGRRGDRSTAVVAMVGGRPRRRDMVVPGMDMGRRLKTRSKVSMALVGTRSPMERRLRVRMVMDRVLGMRSPATAVERDMAARSKMTMTLMMKRRNATAEERNTAASTMTMALTMKRRNVTRSTTIVATTTTTRS